MVGKTRVNGKPASKKNEPEVAWNETDSQRSSEELLPGIEDDLGQVGASKDGLTKLLKVIPVPTAARWATFSATSHPCTSP